MYAGMPDSNPKSKVRDQIDENLKRIYDETLKEEIPDRLTQLLEQLRKKSTDDSGKAS
jgi:hemerythrin-like domain-containing protein